MYAIKRIDGQNPRRPYVAKSGRKSSFTRIVQNMKLYHSREDADAARCPGNEVVVEITLNESR